MPEMRRSLIGCFVLLAALAPSVARAADGDARYALVHGCYALKSAATGKYVQKANGGYAATAGDAGSAEGFRMQATALGRYLLFGKAGDFLAADVTGTVVTAANPDQNADFTVDTKGDAFSIVLDAQKKALATDGAGKLVLADTPGAFTFTAATGCATFPEIDTQVTGTPFTGAAPWSEVRGFVDPHFHWMAFEFLGGSAHCGRPWSPYGVAVALTDCPDHQPDGSGAVLENVLSNGSPYGTHDVHGWPSFLGWPRPESLTHEGSYYKWVERAWRSGLRMATVLLVDNAVLCEVYPIKRNSCDEMESIRLQARDMHALVDYVDAQSGGPGKGFLQIVKDPFEARTAINAGKLAIVLGIESSRLFQCRELNGAAQCADKDIDAGLDEVYDMGVRQMEIVNKFDNALTGVAGDGGTTGLVVNNGNKYETGHYWRMKTCQNLPKDVHDNEQPTAPGQISSDPAFNDAISNYLPTGETPIYPPGPHCNEAGLTPLGEHLIKKMIEKKMIFDPDHMSVKARLRALEILEDAKYSGVVSSHSWSTPDAYPRIYALGGFITPITGGSNGFVKEWQTLKPQAAPKFFFGFGFGSDQNGFHSEPRPRNPKDNPVTYPFKTFDGGSTVAKQVSGTRTYDVNTDGAAHYGLLADWIEDIRKVGGDAIIEDMARGPEAYLEMWERTTGIKADGCQAPSQKMTKRGLGAVKIGDATKPLVTSAGQPQSRAAGQYGFCVRGASDRRVVAGLDKSGHVRLVMSSARGHRAGRIRPGDRAAKLKRYARKVAPRIYVRAASKTRAYVFVTRGAKVRYVGVGTRTLTKSTAQLKSALRRAGVR
jgi:microsomal dipeptidase-like Zn-dependent dipeptidase